MADVASESPSTAHDCPGIVLLLAIAVLITSRADPAAITARRSRPACLRPRARAARSSSAIFAASSPHGWQVTRCRSRPSSPRGLFLGALLAREFEYGTFTWPGRRASRGGAGCSRGRCCCRSRRSRRPLVALLTMWWRRPFDSISGRIGPGGFDIEGLVVPAYAASLSRSEFCAACSCAARSPPCRWRSSCSSPSASAWKLARPHYHRRCTAPSKAWRRAVARATGFSRTVSSTPSDGASRPRRRISRHARPARAGRSAGLPSVARLAPRPTYQPNDRFRTFRRSRRACSSPASERWRC